MLIRSGALSLIVIDSVAALVPRAEIEGEMGDSHVGLQARLMSQALRKMTGALNNSSTTMIFINQLREKIGVMFGSPETTTGGKALKFYSSVRLDVRRIETLKDGTDMVGNRTRVKVVKNKVAPPFKQAEFDIMYGKGISREGGLIDVGVEAGLVRKAGAWYTYEGDQLGQGKENARTFLKDNPDLANELEKKILEKLGVGPTGRRTRRRPVRRAHRRERLLIAVGRGRAGVGRSGASVRPTRGPAARQTDGWTLRRHRPAPAWAGDVHAGVEAWTRSARLSKSGSRRTTTRRAVRAGADGPAREAVDPHARARDPHADRSPARRRPTRWPRGRTPTRRRWRARSCSTPLTGQARSRKELADKLAKKDVPERAGRAPARPVRGGRPDRRRGVRQGVDRVAPAGQGTGAPGAGPRAAAQGHRRRGRARGARRDRSGRRGGRGAGAGAQEAALRARARPAEGDPRLVGMLARKGYGAGMAFASRQGRAEAATRGRLDAGSDDELGSSRSRRPAARCH